MNVLCKGCDVPLRNISKTGYCWRCYKRCRCPICELFFPDKGAGIWCDACKLISTQIEKAHGPVTKLRHHDHDARVSEYLARAAEGLPLTEGLRPGAPPPPPPSLRTDADAQKDSRGRT